MICKNCGHEDLSGAAFCPKCGEKLGESTVQAAPVSVAAPASKKNTAKIIIIVAVIVALLAGAGVVTYFGFFAENPWFISDKADDGDDKKKEEKKDKEEDEEDGEKASREVVEKFLDAYMEFDGEKVAKYLDEDMDFEPGNLDEIIEDMKSTFIERVSDEISYEAYIEEAADIMVKACVESLEYEIKKCEKGGDDYVCTVEVKGIDDSDILDAWNNIDFSALYAEAREMLVEEGIVTGYESSDELTDEQWDEFLTRCDMLILQEIEKLCGELEPQVSEMEIKLKEVDDEWLIYNIE